jgi:hypothetical protein
MLKPKVRTFLTFKLKVRMFLIFWVKFIIFLGLKINIFRLKGYNLFRLKD